MTAFFRRLAMIILVVCVVACGGGDGGDDNENKRETLTALNVGRSLTDAGVAGGISESVVTADSRAVGVVSQATTDRLDTAGLFMIVEVYQSPNQVPLAEDGKHELSPDGLITVPCNRILVTFVEEPPLVETPSTTVTLTEEILDANYGPCRD